MWQCLDLLDLRQKFWLMGWELLPDLIPSIPVSQRILQCRLEATTNGHTTWHWLPRVVLELWLQHPSHPTVFSWQIGPPPVLWRHWDVGSYVIRDWLRDKHHLLALALLLIHNGIGLRGKICIWLDSHIFTHFMTCWNLAGRTITTTRLLDLMTAGTKLWHFSMAPSRRRQA